MKREIIAKSTDWTRPNKLGGRWLSLCFLAIVIAAAGITLSGADAWACHATIGDFVWEDLNANGIQDPGEPGIQGVTVNLVGPGPDGECNTEDDAVVDTDVTDENGYYLFPVVTPYDEWYCVEFVAPDGYVFSPKDQDDGNPNPDECDSDADPTTGRTICTYLGAWEDDRTWDAGLYRASLGDYVWEDTNGNGIQDPNEPGIDDVTVNLFNNNDCSGTPFATTTGDNPDTPETEQGFYLFYSLGPGDYCVEFVKPDGFEFTEQNASGSTAENDSDADPDTGQTTTITLDPGETDLTWDAGLFSPAALGDRVWNDENRNGIQDDNEPGIPDVTVNLFECGDDGLCGTADDIGAGNTATDPDGFYLFEDLKPGIYCVQFEAPEGFVFTMKNAGSDLAKDSDVNAAGLTDCTLLESGETDLTIDSGLFAPVAAIGDFVWEDLNRNGMQDGGEPGIPDVTVNLFECGDDGQCGTDDDVWAGDTTTGADGRYMFEGLLPGTYCVQFVAPTDFEFTVPNQGDDDSRDSDADPDNEGRTECVTLGPDEVNDTLDAGLFRRASLGDFVWEDLNRNGIQDGNEPGIPDVTVELSTCGLDGVCGTDDDVFITSDTTDVVGLYLFDDLVPGDYCVKFEKPAGFSFTLRNASGSMPENDSDAQDDGFTDCVNLESNEFDDTIDAGLVECILSVEKFCSVPIPLKPFVCDDAKPIDSLTMIWDGAKEISEIAVYRDKFDPSNPGKNLMSTITGSIVQGDEVTAYGYVAADARNDVDWYILFTDGTDGVSRFHRSCSDEDMNGPEDCMKNEGNAKTTDPYFVNDWLFEGMAGNTLTLDCTTDPPDFKEECELIGAKPGSCDDDKPTALVFEYTGAACSATTNFQEEKFKCEEIGSLGDLASVVMTKDADKIDVEIIGNTVKIFRNDTLGKEFPKEIKYIITDTDGNTQSQTLHTSCSKPLNLGDQFGSLILKQFIPKGGSVSDGTVIYTYWISHTGTGDVSVDVVDDKLGTIASDLIIPEAEVVVLTEETVLTETTTNTVTVTDTSMPEICSEATDTVTVTVVEPPATCEDGKPTALVFEYTGAACSATTNFQEEKFKCEETGSLGDLASVVMTKDADKIDVEIIGNTVKIFRSDTLGKEFPKEIKYIITDTDGNTQSQTLHTSCSKPLNVGDQFGSLILTDFIPKD
jgi:hypothetical protein